MDPRPLKYFLHTGDLLCLLGIPGTGWPWIGEVVATHYGPDEISHVSVEGYEHLPGRLHSSRYRFFVGELDYEIYRYLPRRPAYVTVLRDPVDRIVSLYERMIHIGEHSPRQNLVEFVTDPALCFEVVNAQTRRIAGGACWGSRAISDQAMLDVAKVHLDEFAWFGLAERPRQMLELLAYMLSWPLRRKQEGLTESRDFGREEIPKDALEAILERTALDRELYRHAQELFEQRYAQMLRELLELQYRMDRVSPPRRQFSCADMELEMELVDSWLWRLLVRARWLRRRICPPGH